MKRETLERNLKRVVSKIEDECTPLRFVEFWGFGSFFRGKEKPGDVDTVAFYENAPELDQEFTFFREYIKSLSDNEKDRNILENIVSNEPRTMEIFKDHCPRLRLDAWAKYTKASFNDRNYGRHHISHEVITRKVLVEGIRGIHISFYDIANKDGYLSSMPTQSFKLIWSKDERDVDKNLEEAPKEQTAVVIAEMENFMLQVEQYKSYYYVLSNISKWVIENIRLHNSVPDDEQVAKQAQIVGNERGILEPYLKWILNWGIFSETGFDEPRYNEKISHLDIESEVAKIEVSVQDDSELGVICESMRAEIKEFQARCAFARELLRRLIGKYGYYHLSIEERIARCAMWALDGVHLNEATDDVKRWVLSDIGLDKISENIVLVLSKRGGATYRLADSEEDLKELIERSKKGKMEKEYEKYISALARKIFPKDTLIRTFFTTSMEENGVPVLDKVGLDVLSRDLDVADFDKLLHIVKKLGFRIKPESRIDPDHFTAEIDIDTSKLNGDKKLIKKLLKSKLSLPPDASPYNLNGDARARDLKNEY